MCGRFAQSQTREEYLAYLADEAERDIAYDPEPDWALQRGAGD